jgi:putative FmdB family regulatory protein
MPKYDYICHECNYKIIDLYQSIHDEALTKCLSCGHNALHRVIYGGLGSFIKEPKTLGSLADNNWAKKGHYEKSEIEEKSKKPEDTSYFSKFGKATAKEINKMTDNQKTKYIITGET